MKELENGGGKNSKMRMNYSSIWVFDDEANQ